MLDKLKAIKHKWERIEDELSQPSVMEDMKRFRNLSKEYKDLKEIVDAYKEYVSVISNIENNKEILKAEKDEEFREMAKSDLEELENRKEELEENIKLMLIPKDPEDSKRAIVEIRAGTGGDEANIFAGDLFRMYKMYFDQLGWNYEILNKNPGPSGGFKEITVSVNEEDSYGILKYESGVHRVQRVPVTESQGRVHTSAASVAVLPEADEVDVEINEKDIKKDTFRASGAGGQHVNKTESAIRLTHIPTGLVVECQDARSQIKNYEQALKVLRTRLYEKALQEESDTRAQKRKSLVSTGDRSAKIRTYNYPQGRVTDHRINLTLYDLSNIMDGNIEKLIEALQFAENAEKLKEMNID